MPIKIEITAPTWKETQEELTNIIQQDSPTMNEQALIQSEKNMAANEKRLYDYYNGMRKDIADIKSHHGHQADIVDTMEDQILKLKNVVAMLNGKYHTEQMANIKPALPNPVLYKWDLSLDGTGIETLTLLPYGSYIFKYMKDGKLIETTSTNQDIKIFEVNGKLAYTVLHQPLGVLMIRKGS